MKRVLLLVMLLVVSLLNGCAGKSTGPQVGKWALYADIEKTTDSSYVISNISNDKLLFDLNFFTPYVDTAEYPCGMYNGDTLIPTERVYSCPPDTLFRQRSVDKAITAFGTVISLGTNALTAKNFKHSVFDFDLFKSAVKTALKDEDRIRYTTKYDDMVDFRDSLKPQNNNNAKILKEGYSAISNKYLTEYENKYKNAKLNFTVQDQSGFYDNSITHEDLIVIDRKSTKYDKKELEQLSVSFSAKPADFEETMLNMKSTLQSKLNNEKPFILKTAVGCTSSGCR